MPILRFPYPNIVQPRYAARLNWGNPLTANLKFCALPFGNQWLDLVTGEWGVNTGTISAATQVRNGGKAAATHAIAASADNVVTTEVLWPISATLRGATMVPNGTLAALGSCTTQTDNNVVCIGGNTEIVTTGNQPALGIDSFKYRARGNICACTWNSGTVARTSTTAALGNPFTNQLHWFGYSFTGSGTDGFWFWENTAETWTGGATWDTTSTNRRARMFTLGDNTTQQHSATIALFCMWDRALGIAEARALNLNPWQLFAPLPAIKSVFTAGAGATVFQKMTNSRFSLAGNSGLAA